MSKTRRRESPGGPTNDLPEGVDCEDCFIPSREEMDRTRKTIRKFLHDRRQFYVEAEYEHYSLFRLQNGLVVDLLAYECEYQEPGDVFVNKPMYDALFGASGSTRLGITNIDNEDFIDSLSEFLGLHEDQEDIQGHD